MNKFLSFVALLALAFTAPAFAQNDTGIYADAVPETYAFVRAVDATGAAGVSMDIGGSALTTTASGASTYVAMPPGDQVLTYGNRNWTVSLPEASIVTIAIGADWDAPVVLTDAVGNDLSKANVGLYNFTDKPLSLTALADHIAVIENVVPKGGAVREIKSVTIDFYVQDGDKVVASFPTTALQRRTLTSIFVFPSEGEVKATVQTDRT